MIISALVSSFGTFIAKDLSKTVHPFLATAGQMMLGSLLLLVFGLPGLKEGAILSAIFIPEEEFNIFIIFALILVVIGILAVNYSPHISEKSGKNK